MNTFTIKYLSDWTSNYATWSDLKTFITSEAGGALKVVESHDGKEAIIRYDKKTSNMSLDSVRWARSIVWDTVNNKPLSVATPKAKEDIVEDSMGYRIEEFIEGFTMSVYKSATNEKKIASRTKFGATGNYYAQRSFADLYNDTCVSQGLPELGAYDFMCIIVQHPEHRIVSRIDKPAWFPLHGGRILPNGDIEITELTTSMKLDEFPLEDKPLKRWFAELAIKKGWQWQGIVLKNKTGDRWRLKSPIYSMVRSLRGDTPRSDERFFTLRSSGMIKTYLSYYPEDKQKYWEMETWLRLLTEQIFNLYCGIYKERAIDFATVPKMYQTHLAIIHNKYIKTLRSSGNTVNKGVVRDYINTLPIPRLLFMLNFNKRNNTA